MNHTHPFQQCSTPLLPTADENEYPRTLGGQYLNNTLYNHDHDTSIPYNNGLPVDYNNIPNIPQGHIAVEKQPHSIQSSHHFLGQDSEYTPWEEDDPPLEFDFPTSRRRGQPARPQRVPPVENNRLVSRRAVKRAKIVQESGSVGCNDTPKGKTRTSYGYLEWYDPFQESWRLAATLDDYRKIIIREDDTRGKYEYPPEHGHHEDDVTTLPLIDNVGQQHWHIRDRSSLGSILDAEGNQVMLLPERPDTDIPTPKPGFMMHNGIILLDPDDHPILDWPGLPRCISSQIEGWRIEAFRRVFPYLSLPQLRSRMPRYLQKRSVAAKPLFGLSSLTQRLMRFRQNFQIRPWKRCNVMTDAGREQSTQVMPAEDEEDDMNNDYIRNGLRTLKDEQRAEENEREARWLGERSGVYRRDRALQSARESLGGLKRKRIEDIRYIEDKIHTPKRQRLPPPPSFTQSSHTTPHGPSTNHTMPPSFAELCATTNSIKYRPMLSNKHPIPLHKPPSIDLRTVAPSTTLQQVAIKAALSYSIADYHYWHGKDPPATPNTSSYLSQLQELQTAHQNRWDIGGPSETEAPALLALKSWSGSFNAVPVPDEEEYIMSRLLPHNDQQLGSYSHLGVGPIQEAFENGSVDFSTPSELPPPVPPTTPATGEYASDTAPEFSALFGDNIFGDVDFSCSNEYAGRT